jgi:hypothetical protein
LIYLKVLIWNQEVCIKYLKRNENGSLGLKEGMIDPMLFNNPFRTPTSSHVSGS